MQYTNFLILSDKESVIVSPFVTFHTLRKKGEIKAVSISDCEPYYYYPYFEEEERD